MLKYIYLVCNLIRYQKMNKQHNRKSKNNNQHERSLDDFMKQIRRYNLKSQRYERHLSPKQPLYMYNRKNNHNIHTLERSRTLSNNKSLSKKTNKSLCKRVQKMLSIESSKKGNGKLDSKGSYSFDKSGDQIQYFSKKIKQTERYLQGKSKIGVVLCNKFLQMLNYIVETMVSNLQESVEYFEKQLSEKLEKEINERAQQKINKLNKKIAKMQSKAMHLIQKQNYNTNLIYYLRMQNYDIDKEFGRCVFGSEEYGGRGYNKDNSQRPSKSDKIDSMKESNQSYEQSNQGYEFINPQKLDRKSFLQDENNGGQRIDLKHSWTAIQRQKIESSY